MGINQQKVNTVLEKLNKCPYRLSDVFDKFSRNRNE